MTRDELIKEIEKISPRDSNNSDGIADFILADRRRICAPLIDDLDTFSRQRSMEKAIDETLKLAGLDKEQG